jgi:AmmeMemoRadiSam system protein B
MRKALVAGQFYPANKIELEKSVKSYVKRKEESRVKGGVVPHAGYVFSGRCAGKIFSVLPEADTYVILGVNHNMLGEDIALSLDNFETPLGIVENDIELGKEILRLLDVREDENAHKHEHSIEVQLPFLQITQGKRKIVPIILKNYTLNSCKELAKVIVDSAEKLKRKIIVLASSDFTHSGPSYGFSGDMKADKKAIDKVMKMNTKGFLDVAGTTTICGAGAIAVAIEAARLLGAKKGELLEYYDSSEIMKGENKVGYASVAFLA